MTLSFILKTHSRFSKNGIEVVGEGQLVRDVNKNRLIKDIGKQSWWQIMNWAVKFIDNA